MFFAGVYSGHLQFTSLKCVLIYSLHFWCSSVQPSSSANRAMPMTLAGSRCLLRKSQQALATSSIWYLIEEKKKHRKLEYLTLKGLLTGGNWRQSVFVCFHLLPMRIIFPSQPATVYVCLPHSTQENVKHTFLSHRDVGGVGEVDEHSHHLRGNVR